MFLLRLVLRFRVCPLPGISGAIGRGRRYTFARLAAGRLALSKANPAARNPYGPRPASDGVAAMQVTVRFFATVRDVVGAGERKVRLPDGATLRALLDSIFSEHPALRGSEPTLLLAVNHEFADPATVLREGDEVAIMPPVSGGAGAVIGVQKGVIDVEAVVDSVRRDDAGAVVLFLGTVRADPGVRALDYEVYRPMALKKMAGIAEAAKARFGVLEVSIVHRLGRVRLGGDSVAIAVAAPHRREAFAACEWAMDQVKKAVPIWKAEG